ncbi:MAG: phospholipid/glycerol acyltransferase [Myxococcales bacterium]|nr:phospholipid/glycerol acyltransferase [Myxococcales bacterium]
MPGDAVEQAEARLHAWSRERAVIAAAVRGRIERRYAGEPRAALIEDVIADERADRHEGRRTEEERRAWRELVASASDVARAGEVFDAIVERYLHDIAGGFDRTLYRAVIGVLPPVLGLAFHPLAQGVQRLGERLVIDGPFDSLRSLASSATLVFAPTHSSNLDSLVVGVALRRAGLPPCVYAAGKHMYRYPVLGRLMANLGAYRVDRAITARLYKDVLKDYSAELLDRGFHSVIFPGATRCRTNEIESQLKLGLLGTTIATDRPVFIVPVTISYQVVLEAPTLIRHFLDGRSEQRIGGDPRPGARRLGAALRRLGALDQSVVVTFGEPVDPAGQPAVQVLRISMPPDDATRWLAIALTRAYRRDTVLFSTQVTARALHDLAVRRAGTEDIHALIGLECSALRFSEGEVYAAIGAVVAMIRAGRDHGRLDRSVDSNDPASILAAAVRAWAACHPRSPAVVDGHEVALDDVGLLYFYRNRTSHLAAAADRE